jgi:hypothetical protein
MCTATPRPWPGHGRPVRRPTSAPACILGPGELPDHLPVVLEFVSTQPPQQARAFLGEFAHILQRHLQRTAAPRVTALRQRAGRTCWSWPARRPRPVPVPPEPALDESWASPAFDGCSTQGQARPGEAQPVQIVRSPVRTASPQRTGSVRMNTLHNFLFTVYPYICLAVFFMGSLARFDRDQYTWKSDSSQLLRKSGSCAGAATCSTAASCSCSSATCSGS